MRDAGEGGLPVESEPTGAICGEPGEEGEAGGGGGGALAGAVQGGPLLVQGAGAALVERSLKYIFKTVSMRKLRSRGQ